jgi:hypothetical protein
MDKNVSLDCRARIINVSLTWNFCNSGRDFQSGSKEHALQRLRMDRSYFYNLLAPGLNSALITGMQNDRAVRTH